MIRRAVIGIVLAVIISAGILIGTMPAAQAFDLCKDVPTPMSPKSGMAGMITGPPEKPVAGNPFTTPQIPIDDVYGPSWHWHVYDLGCTTFSDIPAITNTGSGNFLLGIASASIAVLDLLEKFARATEVDWFADWVGQVATVIKPIVFGGDSPAGSMVGLLILAIVVTSIWIATGTYKADIGEAARRGLVCVGCVAMAAFAVGVPGFASKATDQLVTQSAGIASTSFNASLTDGVNRNAVYRAWLQGQFGDADWKPGVENYGPRIVDATRYTWTEWEQIGKDPNAAEAINDRKATEFKAVADELEKDHPQAYTHFQGRGERTGAGLMSLLVGGAIGLFAFVAFGTILFARVIMQLLVIAAPIAAIAGMLPRGAGVLQSMFNLFVAAIVAVFKFTLAAGLMSVLLGMLSRLEPATALLWMTVVTVAALAVLKPIKTFKTFTPGLDPNRSYIKDLGGLVSKLAIAGATGGVAGAATAAATSAGGPVQAGDLTVNQPDAAMQRVALSTPSPPPLPAPTFHQIEGTNRFVGSQYGAEPSTGAGVPRQPLPAGPGGTGGAAFELPVGGRTVPGGSPVEGPVRFTIDGPITVPANQGQVVIAGEIVPDGGTYQRPTSQPVPPPTLPPPDRDRGTDQPVGELVLYQSHRTG